MKMICFQLRVTNFLFVGLASNSIFCFYLIRCRRRNVPMAAALWGKKLVRDMRQSGACSFCHC